MMTLVYQSVICEQKKKRFKQLKTLHKVNVQVHSFFVSVLQKNFFNHQYH